jgi:hypothetical protein
MEVTKDGFHLVIEVEDLGPQFEFLVAYWRREPGAKVRLLTLASESGLGDGGMAFPGWGRTATLRCSRPGTSSSG